MTKSRGVTLRFSAVTTSCPRRGICLAGDRLLGRVRIAAAQASADLGGVARKVPGDDVQAELAQDRGAGLAFEKELERRPDQLLRSDVTAAQAGGKTGRHTHLVAGARWRLNAESAIGLTGDGDLRHAVTLTSRPGIGRSMHGRPFAVPSSSALHRRARQVRSLRLRRCAIALPGPPGAAAAVIEASGLPLPQPRSAVAFSGLSVFKQVSALIGAVDDCTW
jgi:hypothetical protein